MKIISTPHICQSKYQTNPLKKVSFTGLKEPETPCLFVFDLDGTLAEGSALEIDEIIKTAKNRNGALVYATGRTKKEVYKLQTKLSEKGISLPLPDYLISNNGQFIYENIDGQLVESKDYKNLLIKKSCFDSETVKQAVKQLAETPKYKFSEKEMNELKNLKNFKEIKTSDPEFFDSKISYYEWNPSSFMCEYFVGSSIETNEFKKDISSILKQQGIKTKFIEKKYPKPIMDVCCESILLQSHKLRRHKDGSMTAIFLCPADKADGVRFLKNRLSISDNEILIAGNDNNDVSLAKMSASGAKFICLNNSSNLLKQISSEIADKFGSIYFSCADGAKGILEGISKFIQG